MSDQISRPSGRRAVDVGEVVVQLEPVIARLREREAHCKELAGRMASSDIAKEILTIARDCKDDADRLEASMLFITE